MEKLLNAGKLHESIFEKVELFLEEGLTICEIMDFINNLYIQNDIVVLHDTLAISININNTVYHGLPSSKKILFGDIVTIDLCFSWRRIIIDGAKTFIIGSVDDKTRDLVDCSRNCIKEVINIIDVGCKVKDIITFLSDFVGLKGFYLFPDGVGHGISDVLHSKPFLSISDLSDINYEFKVGDIFTIEPIVLFEKEEVFLNSIGEGIVSKENRSSQFEVTIYIKGNSDILVLNSGLIK